MHYIITYTYIYVDLLALATCVPLFNSERLSKVPPRLLRSQNSVHLVCDVSIDAHFTLRPKVVHHLSSWSMLHFVTTASVNTLCTKSTQKVHKLEQTVELT